MVPWKSNLNLRCFQLLLPNCLLEALKYVFLNSFNLTYQAVSVSCCVFILVRDLHARIRHFFKFHTTLISVH